MRTIRSLLLFTLVAVAAQPLAAQNNFRFVSGKPYGAVSAWGVLVGPYRGQMIAEPGSPTIDMFCVDWFNEVWNGAEWEASFTNMGGGDLSGTRMITDFNLSTAAALDRYQMAAWLSTQMTLDNKGQWGAIQGTIWNVMSGGTATSGTQTIPANSQWYAAALANYDDVDLNEWTIISDVDGNRQEFITREIVPEPGTVLLFGTGLLALGLAAYFRRTIL